jgi:hypothetical protein
MSKLALLLCVILAGCATPLPPPLPVPPPAAPPAPAPRPGLAESASGTLAAFTAALRDAIERHDLAALRPFMAPDFSSGFVGPSNPDIAFAAWRSENFRSLDEAVRLIDAGLVAQGENLWVAPAEYRDRAGYRGLRLGIRRGADGRWVWLFLVRGEG